MTNNLPSQYLTPSNKAGRQVQKLAEAKAANRVADVIADAWVFDVEVKAIKRATTGAARAVYDMTQECMGLMDGDDVCRLLVGKILKTGAQKADARLRDFGDDDFGIFGG